MGKTRVTSRGWSGFRCVVYISVEKRSDVPRTRVCVRMAEASLMPSDSFPDLLRTSRVILAISLFS